MYTIFIKMLQLLYPLYNGYWIIDVKMHETSLIQNIWFAFAKQATKSYQPSQKLVQIFHLNDMHALRIMTFEKLHVKIGTLFIRQNSRYVKSIKLNLLVHCMKT